MTDPFQDDPADGVIDRWLRRLPGLGGYLEKDARRATDDEARKRVANVLTSAKTALDHFARELVEVGNIDAIPACDRVRGRIDLLIARLRGAPSGYGNFFHSSVVTEDQIEDLYDHDLWVLDEAEKLAQKLKGLEGDTGQAAERLSEITEQVESLHQRVDDRSTMLKAFVG